MRLLLDRMGVRASDLIIKQPDKTLKSDKVLPKPAKVLSALEEALGDVVMEWEN